MSGQMRGALGFTFTCALAVLAACSTSSNGTNVPAGPCYTPPVGAISGGTSGALKKFTCPNDPGGNGFVFTVSGEVNAITGYPYPPYDPSQTWMVDGWNWRIDKYIVVLDHITLWTNPNSSSSNQALHGPQVAHVDGPFVVDLHKGGPLDGKGGGGEEALAIAALANQNDNGGAAFDPTAYYAFGFSTVPATYGAINVNLDASEAADYASMVQNGYSVYYSGTANWSGNQTGTSGFGLCSADPQTDVADGNQTCAVASGGGAGDGGAGDAGDSTCPRAYDFRQLPQQMLFQLGFSTPTNYVNCDNYTLSQQIGMNVRGVQTSPSQSEAEQITVHMDHPFWESFEEDTPVHWDQIAAQYIGQTNPVAHTEDLKGVPFDPFVDKNAVVMPWHDCEPSMYAPPGNGAMSFSTLSVPVNPNGTCTGAVGQDFTKDDCKYIRDYYDFIRYTQSTQGHLNSQGLCFIDRQYPAPAGGS